MEKIMAGKVGHINIFGYNFTFVFRHRFEKKKNEDDIWDNWAKEKLKIAR